MVGGGRVVGEVLRPNISEKGLFGCPEVLGWSSGASWELCSCSVLFPVQFIGAKTFLYNLIVKFLLKK